jgi:hypothetical protein
VLVAQEKSPTNPAGLLRSIYRRYLPRSVSGDLAGDGLPHAGMLEASHLPRGAAARCSILPTFVLSRGTLFWTGSNEPAKVGQPALIEPLARPA